MSKFEKWTVIGMLSFSAAYVSLVCYEGIAKAGPTTGPATNANSRIDVVDSIEHDGNTITVIHDNVQHTTCYSITNMHVGGIACVPDFGFRN